MSLAIKYNMAKRKARGGKMCAEGCDMLHEHNYAEGGDVYEDDPSPTPTATATPTPSPSPSPTPTATPKPNTKVKRFIDSFKNFSEGGFVDEEEASGYHDMPEENPEHSYPHAVENQGHVAEMGLVDSIMEMRSKAKGYSMGGRVANDAGTGQEADKKENQFDDLVLRDDLEGGYTGANSGDEIGDDQEDEDRRDIVSMVMKSRRKKDRMPNPA